MGKIAENFLNYMHAKYEKKGLAWETSDEWVWKGAAYVLPSLLLIPALFWLLKYTLIDVMLVKYGFEKTIIFISIIVVIRPLIFELFVKLMKFKEESKELIK